MERPSTPSYGRSHTRRAFHWSRRGPWNAAIVPSGARGGYVNGIPQFESLQSHKDDWISTSIASITMRTTWWKPLKMIYYPEPIYKKQTCTALFEQWSSRFGTLEPQPNVYFKLRVSLSLRSSPMMTSETAFYQSILIYTLTCHQNTFISFILLTPSCN